MNKGTKTGQKKHNMDHFNREQRARNYELNVYECNKKVEVLESFPINVIIPTGMTCNFKCIFCTDRSEKYRSSYTDLSFEQFLNFTKPLSKSFSVGLYGWGEPLMNPEYSKMYDYVTTNFDGIQIHLTTNGSLLNDEWARRLVSYKWSVLVVSLNSANSSTHKLLTGSNKFDRIIDNIRNIIKLREAMGGSSPYLTLSFVSMSQNIEELPNFVDLATKLKADQVVIQDLMILRKEQEQYSLFYKQDLAREMYFKAKEKAKNNSIILTVFSPVSYFLEKDQKWPIFCREPLESFKVSQNGDVFACCYSNTVMGNITNQSVPEIWNGEIYRYYRTHVNSHNLPEECKKCPKKSNAQTLELHRRR